MPMDSNTSGAGISVEVYDILIVGAGPAGISTWLHLNKLAPQLAANTVMIDKAVFPREKVCAGGVGAWSFDVLESLEIDLPVSSIAISEIKFKFENKTETIQNLRSFKSIQRSDFDHALVKTAIGRGLELHEGEALLGLSRSKDCLEAMTNHRHYRVKAIIGADGAFSRVRRILRPGGKRRFAPTLQTFVPVDATANKAFNSKQIQLDFTPVKEGLQGYFWQVPCYRNKEPSMACGIVDFRIFNQRPHVNLKRVFSQGLKSTNQYQGPEHWQSHPIHWLADDDTLSQPNILLVGDAAGIEPAFGGGIHLALSYGEIAAQTILAAFRENNFHFLDYRPRLHAHMAGKVMREFTEVAGKMYGGNLDLSEIVRTFSFDKFKSPDLLSLLLLGPSP